MPETIIGRWGRTLAIRLPAETVRQLALGEGGRVDVSVEGDAAVIRKVPAERALGAMFAGKTTQQWRALYRDAYNWGPDVGREVFEE